VMGLADELDGRWGCLYFCDICDCVGMSLLGGICRIGFTCDTSSQTNIYYKRKGRFDFNKFSPIKTISTPSTRHYIHHNRNPILPNRPPTLLLHPTHLASSRNIPNPPLSTRFNAPIRPIPPQLPPPFPR
jgi:hypothetical protein